MKGLGVRALKQGTASAATATHASAAANEQKGEESPNKASVVVDVLSRMDSGMFGSHVIVK
jgi:hypothetical protein